MNNMSQRVLSLVLALAMSVSMGLTAFADDAAPVENDSSSAASGETTAAAPEDADTGAEQETPAETAETSPQTPADTGVFPGLPDGYSLSEQDLAEKRELASCGTIKDLETMVPGRDYVESEVIFLSNDENEANAYAEAFGGTLRSFGDGVAVIGLPDGVTVKEAVTAAASEDTNLPAVSPNNIYSLDPDGALVSEIDTVPFTTRRNAISAFSWQDQNRNDPLISDPSGNTGLGYQWFHDMIGSYEAWKTTAGSPAVKVAVLDTGIDSNHEDLTYSSISAYSSVRGNTSTEDENGHGTHVCGTIAEAADNERGGSGVAPDVSLISIRVLDADGSGSTADIIAGINRAVNLGADIISMSLGGYEYNSSYDTAIQNAYEHGVTVIAAAGNDGTNVREYPAAFDNVIAVAAVGQDGARAYFSDYGDWVDIAAPGVNILASTFDGGYGFKEGTSMATPIVSGVAALLMSAHPEYKGEPDAVLAALKKTAVKSSSTGIGAGIVNAAALLGTSVSTPVISLTAGADALSFAYGTDTVVISAESWETTYYTINGRAPVIGSSYTYEYSGAIALDAKGSVTVKAVNVSNSGKQSAVVSRTYTVVVPVSSVTITDRSGADYASCVLAPGRYVQLYASLSSGISYSPTLKNPVWSIYSSSGSAVATVSSSGRVTAAAASGSGTVIVRASADSAYDDFTVTVSAPVTSMSFDQSRFIISNDTADSVSADLGSHLLINGSKWSKPDLDYILWTSSNSKVAAVDNEGNVTAVGKGSATITATAADGSGRRASASVYVTWYAESVVIDGCTDGQTVEIAKGKSMTFRAYAAPAGAVSNNKVVWAGEGASNGITVSSSGRVTVSATAETGTITALRASSADGHASAVLNVRVVAGAVQSIILPEKNVTLYTFTPDGTSADTGCTIVPTITGSSDFSSAVMYTTSNASVASVDSEGNVKAVGKGRATITVAAQDGSGVRATCTVTVLVPVSDIAISGAPEATQANAIGAGKSVALKAAVTDRTASNQNVIWSVSDASLASVSSGRVTVNRSYAGGYTTVKVTATAADGSGVSDSVDIPIIGGSVTLLSFSRALSAAKVYCVDIPATAAADNRLDLMSYLTVNTSGTANTALVWSSSAPDVMAVDENGVVTAGTKAGTATITVAAQDGSGKKTSARLTVLVPPSSLTVKTTAALSVYSGGEPTLALGRSAQFTAAFGNAYGTPSKTATGVVWSWGMAAVPYSQSKYASFVSDGSIHDYGSYSAYLTAYNTYVDNVYALLSSGGYVSLSSSGRLSVKTAAWNAFYNTFSATAIDLRESCLNLRVTAVTSDDTYSAHLDVYVCPSATYLYAYNDGGYRLSYISGTYTGSDKEYCLGFASDSWFGDFVIESSNPNVLGVAEYNSYDYPYSDPSEDRDPNHYSLYLVVHSKGTARITITSADGSGLKYSFTVSIR